VATYDLAPEMSAFKLTDKILRAIEAGETDVFIINFANPDMVGHTGNLARTIEAVQHVDTCLGWIMRALRTARGRCLITADHGNCEQMIDPTTGSRTRRTPPISCPSISSTKPRAAYNCAKAARSKTWPRPCSACSVGQARRNVRARFARTIAGKYNEFSSDRGAPPSRPLIFGLAAIA
jgi:hypothetical protein